MIDSLLVAQSNYIGLRFNLNQCGCNHYKGQIEFLTMASNFAVVRSRQPPPGGGLIGSKSYNLQRRDEEPIKTVGSDLVNKLCKCGETYPSLIESFGYNNHYKNSLGCDNNKSG